MSFIESMLVIPSFCPTKRTWRGCFCAFFGDVLRNLAFLEMSQNCGEFPEVRSASWNLIHRNKTVHVNDLKTFSPKFFPRLDRYGIAKIYQKCHLDGKS